MYNYCSDTLNILSDEKRFFHVEGEKANWFYDSFSHSMYSMDKLLYQTINGSTPEEIKEFFSELTMKDGTQLLNFLSVVDSFKSDYTPKVFTPKANAMINTSNKCNLKCSYCYRDDSHKKVVDIDKIKQSIDFIMKRYKPDASEFVLSYSMTSESSLDLSLLKKIADEYVTYESYLFCDDDIVGDEKILLAQVESEIKLKAQDALCNKLFNSNYTLIEILNKLLELKELPELLGITQKMFNSSDGWEFTKRTSCSKWRTYRINRWCLEIKFDQYIQQKKVPFVCFWFMSNGTSASDDFINFINQCGISPFWISIDGPRAVHDYNRKFREGNGSYDVIVENVHKFLQSGLQLKSSSVITTYFPEPLQIVEHLLSLGFSEVSMTPIRPGSEGSFSIDTVIPLLRGYDELFDRLENDALVGNFTLFKALKEDLALAAFYTFLGRNKLVKRCDFDEQIVINTNGDISPCLYFSSNNDFILGDTVKGIDRKKINHAILVTDRGDCMSCWARYLCGGTCFYGSYVSKGDYLAIDPVECMVRKHLAEKALRLLVFINEHNISLNNF